MKSYGKKSNAPEVVTKPSNPNPKTTLICDVVKNPSNANKSMNAPATVSPK